MTHYGLNPSFVYNSPLPLFANLIRRAKRVESDGSVKLLENAPTDLTLQAVGCTVTRRPSGLLTAKPTGALAGATVFTPGLFWNDPSMLAVESLCPRVWRTLDWQMTNKRPDWSLPRVKPEDQLQGSDRGMAVELQAEYANQIGCHLWWCAPPKFELTAAEYEVRLEEMLRAIQDTVDLPPILEYGNELWNDGFAVHGWLKRVARTIYDEDANPASWQTIAAIEIATLKRVADRVFGAPGLFGRPAYYLFVGGQLTVPSHLDRILEALLALGVVPDIAGPALYVTPLKAQKEEWEATRAVPTQDELRASCMARLEEISLPGPTENPGPLLAHWGINRRYGVPHFACYEAGQSLLAGDKPWRKAALEAQETEWMGELYRDIRRVAEAAGVDLLNWYSVATDQAPQDPRVDVFGLLEGTGTNLLPKALAARGD